MILRREQDGDRDAVRAVHLAAFHRPAADPAPEARLVDELRADGDIVAGLSIVAVQAQDVIGHVVCSRAHLDGVAILGLGPLGVLPGHQRHGVGLALMHGVLAAADALGEPGVVLLGAPEYYCRFGFRPAAEFGVNPPDPAWQPHFLLRPLSAWSAALRGAFRYASAFDRI